jgi:hypothetical protein
MFKLFYLMQKICLSFVYSRKKILVTLVQNIDIDDVKTDAMFGFFINFSIKFFPLLSWRHLKRAYHGVQIAQLHKYLNIT